MPPRSRCVALAVVLIVNIASSWYPFALELPERRTNTAQRQSDGTWDLDGDSRVTGHAPAAVASAMAAGQFRFTMEARPTLPNQSGPARLFATGQSPYDASFMVGIEHDEIVLRMPCGGITTGIGAEWRMPMQAQEPVAISVLFGPSGGVMLPTVRVGTGPEAGLTNSCPKGTSPQLPDMTGLWTLGNVSSGHRPFVGRIVRLELEGFGQHVDLLRDADWRAPDRFWVWPERLYQPAEQDMLQAAWHFASFVPLGYLVGSAAHIIGYPRALTSILAFSAVLNSGKLLIPTRHTSLADLLLNLTGAVAGVAASHRRKRTRPC